MSSPREGIKGVGNCCLTKIMLTDASTQLTRYRSISTSQHCFQIALSRYSRRIKRDIRARKRIAIAQKRAKLLASTMDLQELLEALRTKRRSDISELQELEDIRRAYSEEVGRDTRVRLHATSRYVLSLKTQLEGVRVQWNIPYICNSKLFLWHFQKMMKERCEWYRVQKGMCLELVAFRGQQTTVHMKTNIIYARAFLAGYALFFREWLVNVQAYCFSLNCAWIWLVMTDDTGGAKSANVEPIVAGSTVAAQGRTLA